MKDLPHQKATSLRGGDWTVRQDGVVEQNQVARQLLREYEALRQCVAVLDVANVGAEIFSLFIVNPWLSSATLRILPSHEYDDSGGTYLSVTTRVTDVECEDGMEIPEELCTADGDFDADLAADTLEQVMWEFEMDLFRAFRDSDDLSDLTLCIDRAAIVRLIGECAVSGRQAFIALFPEHSRLAR